MDSVKIEDLVDSTEVDEYIPEDPNAPVDDFEISEIEIENSMPEDLKAAIRRYNEIHTRTVTELMEEENELSIDGEIEEVESEENNIIEDNEVKIELKNIF